MFTIPYIETREEFFCLDVFLKLLLGLLAIALVINKSGKGNLAPTSAMDQVIYGPAITLFQFAIVLVIWAFLIIGLRKLKTKILAFRHFIDGTAVIVINRGKIDIAACKKAKITAHDLAFKLRKEGVYYIQNVKRAVLEQNGELIVVLAGEENPKYPIITDGIIHKGVLEDVDKTEEWLLEELHKQGYESVSEIFLAEYYGGQVKVVPYNN